MNSINALFQKKSQAILSVYFTAGYPEKATTKEMICALANAGVDMIEIGVPFSDPLADGPVIQHSSAVALQHGMSLSLLFEQLKDIRRHTAVPLILMTYLNPVFRFGVAEFCRAAQKCGIDGLIIPDLPVREYIREYKQLTERFSLKMIFMITPETEETRIRQIDELSDSFIYLVTASGTTGSKGNLDEKCIQYFQKIKRLHLKNPLIAGFGIKDRNDFQQVCQHINGGIIGSRFIQAIKSGENLTSSVHQFIQSVCL